MFMKMLWGIRGRNNSSRQERGVKEGKMIFYSIDDKHVEDIINTTIMHLEHEE